jgi:hypothetical protein
MPELNNWNEKVIAEFRANEGRVGGNFEGAPIALVHHRGRNSGREYITPMMYLRDEADADTIYVFATRGALRRTRTGTTTSSLPAMPQSSEEPKPTA